MSGSGRVDVTRAGPRVTVVWDRPPLQIFDTELLEKTTAALRSEEVRTAHVVVLEGARRRWSAGLAVEDHRAPALSRMLGSFRTFLEAVWNVPAPTVAKVEGPCLGGGLEVLGACDLALASASATFGQPEVRLGVLAPFTLALGPRELGTKSAAELLLLGETVPASEAARFGLVNRTVPDAELDRAVDEVVARLAGYRRETLLLTKRLLHETAPFPKEELDRAERAYAEELMALPNAEEGLTAFLEKRSPVW